VVEHLEIAKVRTDVDTHQVTAELLEPMPGAEVVLYDFTSPIEGTRISGHAQYDVTSDGIINFTARPVIDREDAILEIPQYDFASSRAQTGAEAEAGRYFKGNPGLDRRQQENRVSNLPGPPRKKSAAPRKPRWGGYRGR